ncbi:MAG: hypothetical protein WCX83_00555 [Candidatus Cloacimonas sp.]|jgi:hypothetical protein|nr:PilN domain-containing protein [Candidatus Cloacimonadota bacterium]
MTGQMFFKINLNKFGELRQKREAEARTFRNTVIIFAAVTVILYGAILFFNNSLDNKLKSRQALLNEINQEIQSFRESGDYLSANDLQRLAKLSTERIFWADKLIALAHITTDKTAITHFSYKDGTLSLFGITQVEVEEKEFDLIHEFIESLNGNPQINADFSDIKFVKSSRDREKDVDIIRFQIDCVGRDLAKKDRRRG